MKRLCSYDLIYELGTNFITVKNTRTVKVWVIMLVSMIQVCTCVAVAGYGRRASRKIPGACPVLEYGTVAAEESSLARWAKPLVRPTSVQKQRIKPYWIPELPVSTCSLFSFYIVAIVRDDKAGAISGRRLVTDDGLCVISDRELKARLGELFRRRFLSSGFCERRFSRPRFFHLLAIEPLKLRPHGPGRISDDVRIQ